MKKLGCLLLVLLSRVAMAGAYDPPSLDIYPNTAPNIPLQDFGSGRLGIIDGSFQRAYLVAAWRAIGGKPLDAEQARQLSLALRDPDDDGADNVSYLTQPWAEAKRQFGPAADKGAADNTYIWGARGASIKVGDEIVSIQYDNCNRHGVRNAAATLARRAAAYGNADQNPWIAEWIRGQDLVFRRCEYDDKLFAAAPADAPFWFKQDRAY